MAIRIFDFSHLFRHTVNFERFQYLIYSANRPDPKTNSCPAYNIEQVGDNGYVISMAVIGFKENDLNITVKENTLIISGKVAGSENNVKGMHCRITGHAFKRRTGRPIP